MKKLLLRSVALWTLIGGSAFLSEAAESTPLNLIESGKSVYQIVIPDDSEPGIDRFLNETAHTFSEILAEGYGAKLPVIREKELPAGIPAIFIGNTAFARANGVNTSKMAQWQGVAKATGKNLILAGLDRPAAKGVDEKYYNYVLGSTRAVTEFLKNSAGVRFLIPGKNGRHIPKEEKLSISANYHTVSNPRFEYCRTRPRELFHDIGNGLFHSTTTWLYGGHSYYSAVPKEKYGKSHPEYFRLVGGSRSTYGNHLCISNPEVQELLYREMLQKLDGGYEMAELAQTDDYRKCECKNCEQLFGTADKGEQLWILHRKLAERLNRERPGKRVLIIAYGPTVLPPQSFNTFPANTAIELCGYDEATFKEWHKIKVPQGFSVYLYNWGNYHIAGLSPKRTGEFLEKQMKLFQDNRVASIYICGAFDLAGLEGPIYYAFFRLMENPDISAFGAVDEFCRLAYQEAEIPMRGFFRTIDERLKGYPGNADELAKVALNPRGVIPCIWDPATLATLERQLATAEKQAHHPKVKARLALVRAEFDFLKVTARALTFYNTYRLNPTWNNFDQLEAEVEKRNLLINRFFPENPQSRSRRLPGWEGVPFFGYITRAQAVQNGTLRGLIGAPFDWNFKLLREKKILPCKDILRISVPSVDSVPGGFDFDSGAWAKAKWNEMGEIQLGTPSVPTRFKVLRDQKNLYIAFDGERKNIREYRTLGKDGTCWGQDCLEVLLDPFGLRDKHYLFMFNAVPESYHDARSGFSTDLLNPNVHKPDPTWDGKWSYRNELSSSRWKAVLTIPFSTFPVPTPVKGTEWTANFGREEYHDGIHSPELLLWAPNPENRSFHDRDKFGELIFE